MPTQDELRKLCATEPDPRLRRHYAESLAKWDAKNELDPDRVMARYGHPSFAILAGYVD